MERRNEGKGRHDWIAVSFALAFHHSIVPAFRPDGRRPRDPLRRHDRGHRPRAGDRSEEHTSELQSQSNLVCRLLLEKKKEYNSMHVRGYARHELVLP